MGSLQSTKFTKVTVVAVNSGPSAAAHTPAATDAEAAHDLAVKSRKDRARDQHLSERQGKVRTSVQQPLRPLMSRE
mgnify:CR=1 FL=1